MSPSSKRRRPPPSSPARGSTRPPVPPPERPADRRPEAAEAADAPGAPERAAPARYGRLGPGAGVAYALLAFLGSSMATVGEVDPDDPAPAIARQLADDRGQIGAGVLLTLLSLVFLVVFVAWLHSWLREVDGPRGWLPTLSLIGGVLMAAMLLVVVMLNLAATVLEGYGEDPVIARTLLVLQWQAVAIVFVPTAAFIGGASLVAYSANALPRWLTYSGLAIAVGLLLPPIAFYPFILSTLWTGMLAVLLLQRARLEAR